MRHRHFAIAPVKTPQLSCIIQYPLGWIGLFYSQRKYLNPRKYSYRRYLLDSLYCHSILSNDLESSSFGYIPWSLFFHIQCITENPIRNDVFQQNDTLPGILYEYLKYYNHLCLDAFPTQIHF